MGLKWLIGCRLHYLFCLSRNVSLGEGVSFHTLIYPPSLFIFFFFFLQSPPHKAMHNIYTSFILLFTRIYFQTAKDTTACWYNFLSQTGHSLVYLLFALSVLLCSHEMETRMLVGTAFSCLFLRTDKVGEDLKKPVVLVLDSIQTQSMNSEQTDARHWPDWWQIPRYSGTANRASSLIDTASSIFCPIIKATVPNYFAY